eukprot:TRINITY_DN737_c0_g2_i8.p1 TRINITY_DN737_c0_g2~~TRINITY_DN737_c0_g2_i8.p1  ORF type:complete len:233 (+),score=36.86 TRINITY_DN737_c0_g2_i8:72-770(+)
MKPFVSIFARVPFFLSTLYNFSLHKTRQSIFPSLPQPVYLHLSDGLLCDAPVCTQDSSMFFVCPSGRSFAGHSHWANIKHQKAKKDVQKAKTFGKIACSIKTAVKLGGPDPSVNSLLAQHLEVARREGFPKDKINNLITGSGSDDTERIVYEGRGPEKILMMVVVETDNKNRSSQHVRSAFNKVGGLVGSAGSAAFMFTKDGVLQFKNPFEEDKVVARVHLSLHFVGLFGKS